MGNRDRSKQLPKKLTNISLINKGEKRDTDEYQSIKEKKLDLTTIKARKEAG